jgi:hypothetical protein
MENQGETQQPHLVLSHKLFLLTHPDVQDIEKVRLKEEVLTTIKSDGNYSPSLRSVINYCAEYNLNRLISCFLFCRYGSVVWNPSGGVIAGERSESFGFDAS